MHTSKLTSQYSTLDDTISKQVVITGDQTTCQINSLTETTIISRKLINKATWRILLERNFIYKAEKFKIVDVY